jgi:hypothetical protein
VLIRVEGKTTPGPIADEQTNVLRHDHVVHQGESVTVTHLAKKLDKNISGANRAQQGQSSITSESNEMQVAESVAATKFVDHGIAREFKTPAL